MERITKENGKKMEGKVIILNKTKIREYLLDCVLSGKDI